MKGEKTMSQIEIDTILTVRSMLPEIVKQLKVMNKLKAVELKLKAETAHNTSITPSMIDDIIGQGA